MSQYTVDNILNCKKNLDAINEEIEELECESENIEDSKERLQLLFIKKSETENDLIKLKQFVKDFIDNI
jgi:hypothetical protein